MISQNQFIENQFKIPDSLYGKVMKFIRLNQKIPNFLDIEIPSKAMHLEKISMLETAIKNGDHSCTLFHDENCLGYLLYLIREEKKEKISESQVITASLYLMALKSPYDIKIININSNQPEDQPYKEQFIESMIKKAKAGGHIVDANKIQEEIIKLKGVDSWLMIATPKHLIKDSEILENDEMLLDQINVTPYFDSKANQIIISSAGIMNSFLLQINPSPILCFLMFGIINSTTLKKLHAAGYHPFQLHGGKLVKPNLEFAHGLQVSPLVMILHDFYHIYSGSLLKKSDHIYLFNTLISTLDKIIETLSPSSTIENVESPFVAQLKKLSGTLADMDIGIFASNGSLSNAERMGSASNSDFFSSWLEQMTLNTTFKCKKSYSFFEFIEKNYLLLEELEKFPNLQDLIKFYFELFKLVKEDQVIINLLGGLNPLVAGKMYEFMLGNLSNFPVKFDINLIKTLCDESNETALSQSSLIQMVTLLKSCHSVNEFNNKILSEPYSAMYLELISVGFPYLPEMISLDENDLQKMKEIFSASIKKPITQNPFGLYNNFVESQNIKSPIPLTDGKSQTPPTENVGLIQKNVI